MSCYFDQNKYCWTDNKDIQKRKRLNYQLNIRKHDRINSHWENLANERRRNELRRWKDQRNKKQDDDENLLYNGQGQQGQMKEKSNSFLTKKLLVQRLNPYMEIFAVIFITFLVLFIICLFLDGEDAEKVSNCFLKFKQLKCSVVRPSDQCKSYLQCLQRLQNQGGDKGEGIKYYFGLVVGFVGFWLKRYIMRGLT